MPTLEKQSPFQRRRTSAALRLIGALVLVAALSALIGWELRGLFPGGASEPALTVLGPAPTYRQLLDQTGRRVDSPAFEGKVQVVTFLFPYCTTYCPLIAAHLVGFERLLQRAGLQDRVQVVAFNVDPAHTGVKQMRAFLKEYGWNPDDRHWEYLTGRPETIRRVVTGGFHIAYERVSGTDTAREPAEVELSPQPEVDNPLAKAAHVDYDISHNDALVLVDPQGRIRKIYDQADVVSNGRLLAAVRRLIGKHG